MLVLEVKGVTIRKWFYLFWTTLVIGAVAALVIGFVLQANDQKLSVLNGNEIGFNVVTMLLGGAMISVLSQMGFFAYLIIRFIAMGMIKSKWIWDTLQFISVIIALIDLVYLRHVDTQESWLSYMVLPILLLCVGVITAWWKVKLTNRNGFIPTLFFMTAVTAIEAVPALRIDSGASTLFMMIPLLACNAWQILILSKVLNTNKEPQ
jgi:KinB signaling pathway activation protein